MFRKKDESEDTRIVVKQIIEEIQRIVLEAGDKVEFNASAVLEVRDEATKEAAETICGQAEKVEVSEQTPASTYDGDVTWNDNERNTKMSYCDEMPEHISTDSTSTIWYRCGCTYKKEFVKFEVDVAYVEENVRTVGTQTELSFSAHPPTSLLLSSTTGSMESDSGVCQLSAPCTLSLLDSRSQSVTGPLYGDILVNCHDDVSPGEVSIEESISEEHFCGLEALFNEPETPSVVESKTADFEQVDMEDLQKEQLSLELVNQTNEEKVKFIHPTDADSQKELLDDSKNEMKLTEYSSADQENKNDMITYIFCNVNSHQDRSQPSTSKGVTLSTANVQCDSCEFQSSKKTQLSFNKNFPLRTLGPNSVIINDEGPNKDGSTNDTSFEIYPKFWNSFLKRFSHENFRRVSRINITVTEIGVQASTAKHNLSHCLANSFSYNERFNISKNKTSFSGQWKELCDSRNLINKKNRYVARKGPNSGKEGNTCSSCEQNSSRRTNLKAVKITISEEKIKLRLQTAVERRKKYSQRLSRRRAFILNKKLSKASSKIVTCEKRTVNKSPHYRNLPHKIGGDQVTFKEPIDKSDEVVLEPELINFATSECKKYFSDHRLSCYQSFYGNALVNTAESFSNLEQPQNSKEINNINLSFIENEDIKESTSEVDHINVDTNSSHSMFNEVHNSMEVYNHEMVDVSDMAPADRRIFIEKNINKILLDKKRRQCGNVYESAYNNETCTINNVSVTQEEVANASLAAAEFSNEVSVYETVIPNMNTAYSTKSEKRSSNDEPRSPTFSNADSLHSSQSVNSIITVIKNKRSYKKTCIDSKYICQCNENDNTLNQNVVEEINSDKMSNYSTSVTTVDNEINQPASTANNVSNEAVSNFDLAVGIEPIESNGQRRTGLLLPSSSISTFILDDDTFVPGWFYQTNNDQEITLNLGDQDTTMTLTIRGTVSLVPTDDLGIAGTSGAGDGFGVHNETLNTSSDDDVTSLESLSANNLQKASFSLSSEDTIIDKVTDEYCGMGTLELTESRVQFYKRLNCGFAGAGTSAKLEQNFENVASGGETDISCSDNDGQEQLEDDTGL